MTSRRWGLAIVVCCSGAHALWAQSRPQPAATILAESPSIVSSSAVSGDDSTKDRLSFNRHIRPILARHCWHCHGPDAAHRQGGLRLDGSVAARQPAESGRAAIVPGDTDHSELLVRLTTPDLSLRMPPEDAISRPTDEEVSRLRQWIAEGAEFEPHWSFVPIKPPDVPSDHQDRNSAAIEAGHSPIDAFVIAKLTEQGLTMSPAADRSTWLRRVTFDLTGLPPTLEELDRLPVETNEQIVDRLLASPFLGERLAVDWLDVARYADTDGYFGDKPRDMWLWREGLIRALNENQPFDQFTREQLAGDMLPEATLAQRIASGFNRNHMSNDETGLIDEEYRVEYVADRVDTTASTWLGLTVACAQCHDHKFDPISQREYYQLFAFFNNVPEQGLLLGTNAPPRIQVPSAQQEQRRHELQAALDAAQSLHAPDRQRVAELVKQGDTPQRDALPLPPADRIWAHISWDDHAAMPNRVGNPMEMSTGIRGRAPQFDGTQHDEVLLSSGDTVAGAERFGESARPVETNPSAGPLVSAESAVAAWNMDGPWTLGIWMMSTNSLGAPWSRIEPTGHRRGVELLWQKGRLSVNLVHSWNSLALEVRTREKWPANQWHHVIVSYDGSRRAQGLTVYVNGRPAELEAVRNTLGGTIENREPLRLGRRDSGLGFYGSLDEFRGFSRAITAVEAAEWTRGERLRGICERPVADRSAADVERLIDDVISTSGTPDAVAARDRVLSLQADIAELNQRVPWALVMEERSERRPTFVLQRGQYNHPGEEVTAGVPAAVAPWPAGAPLNRVGLAEWLTDRQHPLTARVLANRLWTVCFGEGLVRTPHDFGTQGEPPSHPELLDYLAWQLHESGWNIKLLLRSIVLSQTYQQDSAARLNHDGEVIDPENRWLSRGPRFRLPWEMVRDQALLVSGLLTAEVGGRSVKPYQPPGLWEEVSYNADDSYDIETDRQLWRRSLYSYVKRQAPPPALLVFDGPTREKCTLRRPRTNTPLQGLVLLNEETFWEAARHTAAAVVQDPSATDNRSRLSLAMKRVLSRLPRDDEQPVLLSFVEQQRQRFLNDGSAARRVLSIGASPSHAMAAGSTELSDDPQIADVAAWTVLVHTLLNLDEALTRP
jgi:hypothetical protein